MSDIDLLRQFVSSRDEEAFRQIVQNHINMVYAAAVRQVGEHALAEDVTQAVFIVLAKKAAKVNGATLAGWLLKATRLVSMDARRGEARRKNRERKVAAMKVETYTPQQWPQFEPMLDEMLSSLREKDRTAVTLRYLEERDIPQVAATMGITQDAAAKRLTRAMAKLRRRFARKGKEIPEEALGASMLTHAHLVAPGALAGRTIATALGPGKPGALAQTMIDSMTAWTTLVWFAMAAFILVVGGVSFELLSSTKKPSPPVSPVSVTSVAPIDSASPHRSIRVGILISHFTAVGPHAGREPYGYQHLHLARSLCADPNIEQIPIIEPGSANEAEVNDILRTTFRDEPMVDGSNAEQLMTLDVIACPAVFDETPDVLNAIESTVRQGRGLLILSGLGLVVPGSCDQVDRLNGLIHGTCMSCTQTDPSVVIADHPLLGSLTKGDELMLEPIGLRGALPPGALALIQIKNIGDLKPIQVSGGTNLALPAPGVSANVGKVSGPPATKQAEQNQPSAGGFYPLYLSSLGKGKIVGCDFCACDAMPDKLQSATGSRFMIRCVKWLAKQPLD